MCVSLAERRGDAPAVPQGAPEAKAQRPPVRVLTPNPQPAPSKPPSSFLRSGNPKQGYPQMMLRREAGSGSSPPPPSV